jgi:DNA gyrase/topoisomerase IV subunit A
MKRSDSFLKINNKHVKINGISETFAVYRNGQNNYEIQVDETDRILCLTTTPEEYLDKKLTIPTGQRDNEGRPIYKVVELKAEFRIRKGK